MNQFILAGSECLTSEWRTLAAGSWELLSAIWESPSIGTGGAQNKTGKSSGATQVFRRNSGLLDNQVFCCENSGLTQVFCCHPSEFLHKKCCPWLQKGSWSAQNPSCQDSPSHCHFKCAKSTVFLTKIGGIDTFCSQHSPLTPIFFHNQEWTAPKRSFRAEAAQFAPKNTIRSTPRCTNTACVRSAT